MNGFDQGEVAPQVRPIVLDSRDGAPRAVASSLTMTPHVAIGADGLIIEAHPAPEKAISDGAQSLDMQQFAKMMEELKPYIELWKDSRRTNSVSVAAI